MRFTTLSQWLEWQETLHFTEIDPGLDRIGLVWQNMQGQSKLPFKLVTVAGTNGKGSSVALTSSILMSAGYKTATYTSPHLLRYNERISIDGHPCSDEVICAAFERIDRARGDISLTYFEFATLAAADIFRLEHIDIAVMEVGMGGRLDAVNLFDTDVALITPIGLDHTAWLGDTREKIGLEKAGIIRANTPVVCSENGPPITLIERAKTLGAPAYIAGNQYTYSKNSSEDRWSWDSAHKRYDDLPSPGLVGSYQRQNSAAVIQVCQLLSEQGLSIPDMAIYKGIEHVCLAGRFQVVEGEITTILDVTHNEQGAENLAELLSKKPIKGKTYAVLGMLRDKDSEAVARILNNAIDFWFLSGLDGSRGSTPEELLSTVSVVLGDDKASCHKTVEEAYKAAIQQADHNDRVLVFGSFHTVEAVMRLLPQSQLAYLA
ncbi:MAG TPA: bifunctional tetrahydrofolate synthase/dihydrofolate synthase [Methylophaga aminisulfidivorans]|uniref:Dihydrofolate synthase/folylpolyglutamate synthase n=3 Tax=root TaxID=1 RepID=A0A7C1ZT42_9GAMM|nr:bifunctional tetrahydrofolate synthase/dihydrofolate synthase [Methylophaga aminisulfidivorans]